MDLEDKLFSFSHENFSQPLYCLSRTLDVWQRMEHTTDCLSSCNRLGPHLLPNLAMLWDLAAPTPRPNPVESKAG